MPPLCTAERFFEVFYTARELAAFANLPSSGF